MAVVGAEPTTVTRHINVVGAVGEAETTHEWYGKTLLQDCVWNIGLGPARVRVRPMVNVPLDTFTPMHSTVGLLPESSEGVVSERSASAGLARTRQSNASLLMA